jgi:YcxB-like protein
MNEVTYCVQSADMKAFMRHNRRISPEMRRARIITLLLCVGLSAFSATGYNTESMARRVVYFFCMMVVFFVLMTAIAAGVNWLVRLGAFKRGDRHGVFGEHTVTLTPEALHERTKVNDSKAAWAGIYRIDDSRDHIFIFTQPNAAHVIPRRAFPTPSDADQFVQTARSYFDAARCRERDLAP